MSSEDEVIKHSDIIYWYKSSDATMQTKFIKDRDTRPTKTKYDLGYTYEIFLFKEQPYGIRDLEKFAAIIGDSYSYVERMIGIGYSGVMIKKNARKKDSINKALKVIFHTFGFADKDTKPAK